MKKKTKTWNLFTEIVSSYFTFFFSPNFIASFHLSFTASKIVNVHLISVYTITKTRKMFP